MYSHIFASMYQGTMMGRSDLLLVFPCLLAHCDAAGNVDLHPKALSSMTGLPEDRVRAALTELEQDDPESRTNHPQYGGKRIVRIDEHRPWGWFVVNYGKYRDLIRANSIREQARIRQERKREKDAGNAPVTPGHAPVTDQSQPVTHESRKEEEEGKEKEKEKEGDDGVALPPGNGKDDHHPKLLDIPSRPPEPRKRPKTTPTRFDITLEDGTTWNVPEEIPEAFYLYYNDDGTPIRPMECLSFKEADAALLDLVRKSALDAKHRPTAKGAARKVSNWLSSAIKFRNRDAEKSAGGHR